MADTVSRMLRFFPYSARREKRVTHPNATVQNQLEALDELARFDRWRLLRSENGRRLRDRCGRRLHGLCILLVVRELSRFNPGFYLVLLQERANGAAAVAFVDNSIRDARTSKVVAAVVVSTEKGPEDAPIQPIFADDQDVTRFLEIRLPGKILKFAL